MSTNGDPAVLTRKSGAIQSAVVSTAVMIVLLILIAAFAPEQFGQYQRVDESSLKREIMLEVREILANQPVPEPIVVSPPPDQLPVIDPLAPTEEVKPDRLDQLQMLVGTVKTLEETLNELRTHLTDPESEERLERIEAGMAKLDAIDGKLESYAEYLRIHATEIDRLKERLRVKPQSSAMVPTPAKRAETCRPDKPEVSHEYRQ